VNLANRINLTGVNQLWVADASLIAAQIRELGVGRILYHCGGGRLRRDASDLNFAFAFFLFMAQSCAQQLYWALASLRLFGGRETVVTQQSIRSFHVERTYSSVRQSVDPLGYQVVSASKNSGPFEELKASPTLTFLVISLATAGCFDVCEDDL
jgi:hypothetical protein